MHVYHYAAYERSALTRLMGEHGTREQEVDDFLRQEVLVDLYRVVKQSLRASVDSYSIKAIEKLYGFERTADVSGGDESVVRFEEWLESGDDSILEEVERYNEEDCRSTFELDEWLRSIRPGDVPWREPPDQRERTEAAEERDEVRAALKATLLDGAEEGEPRRLLAHLVDYHQREQRPGWWEWFRWPQLDEDDLIRDRTAIGGLVWDGADPVQVKKSLVYRLDVPRAGAQAHEPGQRPRHAQELPDRGHRRRSIAPLARSKRESTNRSRRRSRRASRSRTGSSARRCCGSRGRTSGWRSRYPALVRLLEREPPAAPPGADPVAAALALATSTCSFRGRPARERPGRARGWRSR